jgi:hypothetical protein
MTAIVIAAAMMAFGLLVVFAVIGAERHRRAHEIVTGLRAPAEHYVTAVIYHADYPRLKRAVGHQIVSARRFMSTPRTEIIMVFDATSPAVAERCARRALGRLDVTVLACRPGGNVRTRSETK